MFFWYFCSWDSTVWPKIRRHFRNKSRSILKLSKMYFTKNVVLHWYSSMKFFRKIRTFFDIENWLWMSRFHDFQRRCAISALQISKNHFATFDSFVKMKLVPRGLIFLWEEIRIWYAHFAEMINWKKSDKILMIFYIPEISWSRQTLWWLKEYKRIPWQSRWHSPYFGLIHRVFHHSNQQASHSTQ